MSSLGDKLDQWLAAFDWEAVTAMNAALCAKTGSLHRPTSDGHEPCRERWVAAYRKEMSFRETPMDFPGIEMSVPLDLPRKSRDFPLRPVTISSGSR